ncbi:hypothetical protein DFH07DRAFT_965823 [Mycena maculata]|uniref:Uncharacterized protein n=1 Tax=Mycena maculata TaxID=230809 RepID=A0AAD7ID06_9AGAR|nr:hypothetical protein DFH07DRAFT_965823 [Mycena maculata]
MPCRIWGLPSRNHAAAVVPSADAISAASSDKSNGPSQGYPATSWAFRVETMPPPSLPALITISARIPCRVPGLPSRNHAAAIAPSTDLRLHHQHPATRTTRPTSWCPQPMRLYGIIASPPANQQDLPAVVLTLLPLMQRMNGGVLQVQLTDSIKSSSTSVRAEPLRVEHDLSRTRTAATNPWPALPSETNWISLKCRPIPFDQGTDLFLKVGMGPSCIGLGVPTLPTLGVAVAATNGHLPIFDQKPPGYPSKLG